MANRLLFSRSIHTIATKPSLFSTRKLDGLLLANCDVSLVGCTYQAKKKQVSATAYTGLYQTGIYFISKKGAQTSIGQ